MPHIVIMLRFAGFMLVIYAFLGGLLPPPEPFPPGNMINSQNYVSSILEKLNLSNRIELATNAIQYHLSDRMRRD